MARIINGPVEVLKVTTVTIEKMLSWKFPNLLYVCQERNSNRDDHINYNRVRVSGTIA